MYEPTQVLPGVLLTLLLILISHVAVFWPRRRAVPRLVTYAIGTLCISAGLLLTSALTGDWRLVVGWLWHLVPAGVLTLALWGGQLRKALADEAAKDAAGIEEVARRHERTY